MLFSATAVWVSPTQAGSPDDRIPAAEAVKLRAGQAKLRQAQPLLARAKSERGPELRATLAQATRLVNDAQSAALDVQRELGGESEAPATVNELVRTLGHLQADIFAATFWSDPDRVQRTLTSHRRPGTSGAATIDSEGYVVDDEGHHLPTPQMWVEKWCKDGKQIPDPDHHTPPLICPSPGSPPSSSGSSSSARTTAAGGPSAATTSTASTPAASTDSAVTAPPSPPSAPGTASPESCCLGFPLLTSAEYVAGYTWDGKNTQWVNCILFTSADGDGSGNPDNIVYGAEDECGGPVRAYGQPILYFNNGVSQYVLQWGQNVGATFDTVCYCGGTAFASADYLGPYNNACFDAKDDNVAAHCYPKQTVDGTWMEIAWPQSAHWYYYDPTHCVTGYTPDLLACYSPGSRYTFIPDAQSIGRVSNQYLVYVINEFLTLYAQSQELIAFFLDNNVPGIGDPAGDVAEIAAGRSRYGCYEQTVEQRRKTNLIGITLFWNKVHTKWCGYGPIRNQMTALYDAWCAYGTGPGWSNVDNPPSFLGRDQSNDCSHYDTLSPIDRTWKSSFVRSVRFFQRNESLFSLGYELVKSHAGIRIYPSGGYRKYSSEQTQLSG